MTKPSEFLERLKKDVSELIKNQSYSKILDRINDFENSVLASGILQEIEDLQKSRDSLAKSEEKFRKLSDLSPAGISIQRKNKYLYVNKAWSHITGYEEEDIKRIGPFDIIHPDMVDYVQEVSNKNLRNSDAKVNYNLRILTKQQKEKWLEITIAPILYERKFSTIAIFTDITEIYKSREALKNSEKKYRGLIENLRHEYIFFRIDTQGFFEYVSPSIQDILGYDPNNFKVHYSKYFTDNQVNKVAVEKTELTLMGILQFPFEVEYYDIQKNKHYIEVSETPVIDNLGNVTAVDGIAHDITFQKKAEETIKGQLEEIKTANEEIRTVNEDLEDKIDNINILNEQLRENEKKLKESNDQKDRFFSLLAHDLRSPVGNFLQISELLKLQYNELPEDQIKDFFDNLHKLADKTFKLLENLLMWSRSQLGTLEIKKKELNLYMAVEDVVFLFEENLKSKNILCINKLPQDLMVKADINILQTLLRNLISNAIKFSYPKGEIVLESKLEKNAAKNYEYYIISIQDSGIGIPEDKIEVIFNMNAEYTTYGTANEKGTGLGLVLCKELIEKCGEKMWVGSEEGVGTTFYFTLKR